MTKKDLLLLLSTNLIKNGKKYKALQIVISTLKNIKILQNTNVFDFFFDNITKLILNVEILPVTYYKKKNMKKRGKFRKIFGNRIFRRLLKLLLLSAKKRIDENSLDLKLAQELIDLSINKSIGLQIKKEFLLELKELRPSAILINRRRRRKRISKL